MANKKGEDPAPYYGLSSSWVDENGRIQSDFHIWIQNRPNHEIRYYGKPKGWMPKRRLNSKWAIRYDDPQKNDEEEEKWEDPLGLMVEDPLDEFDPALVEDDDDDHMMPELVLTDQDLINSDAYYMGYSKHMIEGHRRYDHKKWWQFWIKENDFPRYPIEKEPVTRDRYGRVYISKEVYEKILKWAEEVEKKKRRRIF